MRKNSEQSIQYDDRWLSRREWIVPALLFRNISAYNKKTVYSKNTAR